MSAKRLPLLISLPGRSYSAFINNEGFWSGYYTRDGTCALSLPSVYVTLRNFLDHVKLHYEFDRRREYGDPRRISRYDPTGTFFVAEHHR